MAAIFFGLVLLYEKKKNAKTSKSQFIDKNEKSIIGLTEH